MSSWIALAVVAVVAVYAVLLFNKLVRARQVTREAWSGIDVQLKRRADLIPNLVETVKGYAGHERQLFEEVTRLRNQAAAVPRNDVAGREQAETALAGALGRLIAVAEDYPDLKASNSFLELQKALSATEDEIQMARRYYNGATRDLNVLVESFPSNLVAQMFGFQARDYFQAEADDRILPEVKFQQPGA